MILFIVLIALTGCQWQQKRAIKKLITDHYTQGICVPWPTLREKRGDDFWIMAGLLEKKEQKTPEGIMGYALEKKYILSDIAKNLQNDAGSICYGVTHVEVFKDLVFEDSNHASVSFVTGGYNIQDWAQDFSLEQGKHLHRVTVQRSSEKQWQIVNK